KKGSYGLECLDASSHRVILLNDALPQEEKDPGSFTSACYINNISFEKALADIGASVSVMPLSTYLNLGLGELVHTKWTVKLEDRTVEHAKGIAKNVLVGIDPLYGDYIELINLNEPLEFRRNQVDALEPTIEEGKVVDKPMFDEVKTRNDGNMINRINRYPSYCDYDRITHIDYVTANNFQNCK
nr:hypothetical protein [Tanacetum cinerariifolium]